MIILTCVLHLPPCQHLDDDPPLSFAMQRCASIMILSHFHANDVPSRIQNQSSPPLRKRESLRHSVKSWMSLKARYTIGESNTALFKRLSALILLRNLIRLQSALKNWNICLRLFAYRVFSPECRFRKSFLCWSTCITRWVISIASKNYVRHWGWLAAHFTTISSVWLTLKNIKMKKCISC